MQRCVYAIPNSSLFKSDEIMKMEKDVEESRITPSEFRTKLQVSIYISMIGKYYFSFAVIFFLPVLIFFL